MPEHFYGPDGLEVLEPALIATQRPTVARVSGATSHTFTGLDGNADVAYEILLCGTFAFGGAAKYVSLRPNGDSGANYQNASGWASGASEGATGSPLTSGLYLVESQGAADGTVQVRGQLAAAAGYYRTYTGLYGFRNATPNPLAGHVAGWWTNTASNITSLEVNFGGGTFTGTIVLKKLLDPVAFPVGQGSNIPVVTSLPASPFDGQEVYYAADIANGIKWHLKYNATSVSIYKWEYLGGNPKFSEVLTNVGTVTSTSYVSSGSAGSMPSVVAPLAGEYDIELYLARANMQTSSAYAYISPSIGGVTATDADGGYMYIGSGAPLVIERIIKRQKTIPAANSVVQMQARTTSGTFYPNDGGAQPLRTSVLPKRVS